MKRTNVYLEEAQLRLLRHLAIERERSFTAIVREALTEYLVRQEVVGSPRLRGPHLMTPDDAWRARLDAVLERLRADVPPDLTSEEIEAEITAGSQEVRQERAALRRAERA